MEGKHAWPLCGILLTGPETDRETSKTANLRKHLSSTRVCQSGPLPWQPSDVNEAQWQTDSLRAEHIFGCQPGLSRVKGGRNGGAEAGRQLVNVVDNQTDERILRGATDLLLFINTYVYNRTWTFPQSTERRLAQ